MWAYRTSFRTTYRLKQFQLVYGLEEILPIECEIPSLKLFIKLVPTTSAEEEHLLHLTRLDETYFDATMANETHKRHIKA